VRVIAQRPGGYYLVDIGGEQGCIVEPDGTVNEPHSIIALEARGYWEDFTGDPEPILAVARAAYFDPTVA